MHPGQRRVVPSMDLLWFVYCNLSRFRFSPYISYWLCILSFFSLPACILYSIYLYNSYNLYVADGCMISVCIVCGFGVSRMGNLRVAGSYSLREISGR